MQEDCISKISVLFALILFTGLSMAAAEDYNIVAFETVGSHTWQVPNGVDEVDVLVVGGGGGGAGGWAGDEASPGGGGGEVIISTGVKVQSGSYDISVGSGGSGGSSGQDGEDGQSSSAFSISANGGFGAVSNGDPQQAASSGSGNLGGYYADEGQYNDEAGGGGGDGGAGQDASTLNPGDGGVGTDVSSIFSTQYGENGFFGGGGGGGGGGNDGTIDLGKGGKGGGGNGGDGYGGISAEDGEPNTGGGGGGGQGTDDPDPSGGDGGSGIVLIKYKSGPSICDKRGPLNECITNSSHSISGQSINISSVFQAENTAVFEALSGISTLNITNSTSLSGLWKGEFSIQTNNPRIEPGAEFRPANGNIVIGE
jgi:hypothetical protein